MNTKSLSIFKTLALSIMLMAGIFLFAACNDTPPPADQDPIPSNAITINSSAALIQAINGQQDNQYWVLEAGSYDLDPSQVTIEYGSQTGWYLPITHDGITIRGSGDVTLMSTHDTPNAAWASQNLITIAADNVTIRDVKIVCKKEVNKAIEILGENATIKNVTFNAPTDYDFAGSIYLNTAGANKTTVGTLTLENVTLNKGRITASNANAGKIVFKNVTIDWTGIEPELIDGYYGMLNFNGKSFTYEGANTVTVKMSATELGSHYQDAVDALIPGVNKVNVDEQQ